MNLETYSVNRDKVWNHNLPNQVQALSAYDDSSTDAIGLFLIFRCRPEELAYKAYIAKTATHARRTWIQYTDAVERKIPLKFYVESEIKDEVVPILRENGVDVDNDILWFTCETDPSAVPSVNVRNAHRKKMCFIKDQQLSKYKWVLLVDSDLFVSKPRNATANTFPLFQRLSDQVEEYGVGFIGYTDGTFLDEWLWRHKSVGDTDKDTERYHAAISPLVTADHLQRIKDEPTSLIIAHCGLHAFPAKHYMTNRVTDCQWLYDATQRLDSDELALAIYQHRGETLWDFSQGVLEFKFSDYEELVKGSSFFLSHPHDQYPYSEVEEKAWRESIGV